MKRWSIAALTLVLALAAAMPAWAQGGGASSTGTIQGRVTDAQGAVLPGVTVTASSPTMLGQQTTVSSETGNYRFPAVPPGTYTVTYELAGFNTLRREGIQIALGFTANVNVELTLATLQETVTVTGESPIIDTSSTRVQQNFKVEQLQSIPNGRDMWSLLAVTPSIQMGRIDVGGNRAGTQTGYNAYGFSGQVRVLIEGINTTEGTGGAGFYFDYSSLEEVFMGTSGQGAEMPNPGVQSQFIAKSGGNQFSGEYYLDWYNNSLQGSNLDNVRQQWPTIREGSNEMDHYYDTAINVGGPIKKDKIWYFGTYRTQFNAVAQPQFRFDKTFDTKLWNPVVKGTYQINQKNKLIGYYQWGQKTQPNRLPYGTYFYNDAGSTNKQDSGSWVYKAEWNGTLTDKLYVESRYGEFGYYFPLTANSDEQYFWRDTGAQELTGAQQRWQLDRTRKQITGAATYFLDTGKGSHTFKAGGEYLNEIGWEGYEQQFGGNIDHQYANGVASQVVFTLPTATQVGQLRAGRNGDLTSISKLDVFALFLNDTWSLGRLTLNGGLRYDRYHGSLPEQQQLASTGCPAQYAAQCPVSVPAATFPQTDLFTWNQVAPRIGGTFDLSGDGKTVIKANYGLFWHNPGVGVGSSANPNTTAKSATYNWTDLNGDRRWQPGEEGARTAQALQGSIRLDPGIKAPLTHEAAAWLERQLTDTMGLRAGFVYKTQQDMIQSPYVPGRSVLNGAYSVPFPFTDIGVDGRAGTADDRVLTLYGLPSSQAANFPLDQVVMNVPRAEDFRTFELSANRRYSNKWSGQIAYSHTWLNDYPATAGAPNGPFPLNPNQPGKLPRTTWQFKATGSYDAMWGIRVSPVLRAQSGENFAREISVPGSAATPFGLVMPASTIYADAADANRQDNIWVFDVRLEKTINVTSRARFRAFLDFFNITNSDAAETITRTTGTNFLRPATVLAPFTTRLGFRFLW